MVKTGRLASATSVANNMSLQAGISPSIKFEDEDIPPGMCKSALKNRLKLEMVNCFLDYNLQPLLRVLGRIKQSQTFNYNSVHQEFYPAPPAIQAMMKITFLNDKKAIRVKITRKGDETLTANSRRKGKTNCKLIDVIRYLEETFAEL